MTLNNTKFEMRNLHSRIRWRRNAFDFDSALRPGRGTAQDQNDFDFDSALRPGGDTAQDQNQFDFDPALRPGGDTAQDHKIGMDFNGF